VLVNQQQSQLDIIEADVQGASAIVTKGTAPRLLFSSPPTPSLFTQRLSQASVS
jgi:hypothetical protein